MILFKFFGGFVLLFISFLHIYWGFGGLRLTSKVIPVTHNGEKLFEPGRLATFFVAFFLMVGSLILLAPAHMPETTVRWGSYLFAFIFFARGIGEFRYIGLFKRVRKTEFAKADTYLYVPLMFLLSYIFSLNLP